MSSITKELIELSDFAYQRLRTRLEGLTDEEYLWEPAPNCWSIRPNGDGTYRGDGGFVWDEVPPVTTIAWRLSHLIDCISAERCATWLGLERKENVLADGYAGTADRAMALLERANEFWRGYITEVGDDAIWEKSGPIAGIYADYTRVSFVLHIIDELVHHGAEIGVLRDLYRAERLRDPLLDALLAGDRVSVEALQRTDAGAVERMLAERPELMREAAATGRWAAIPLLAELGFPITSPSGRTALHHAAAAGRIDAIRTLIDVGADLTVKDPTYDGTPLGWAEYMLGNHPGDASLERTVEFLRGVTLAQTS
jgi:hypothetical protein